MTDTINGAAAAAYPDPESPLYRVLMLLRGAEVITGKDFVTIEVADGATADPLSDALTDAMEADKALWDEGPGVMSGAEMLVRARLTVEAAQRARYDAPLSYIRASLAYMQLCDDPRDGAYAQFLMEDALFGDEAKGLAWLLNVLEYPAAPVIAAALEGADKASEALLEYSSQDAPAHLLHLTTLASAFRSLLVATGHGGPEALAAFKGPDHARFADDAEEPGHG